MIITDLNAAPPAQYDVVLADPPWRFASNSKAKPGRNAQRHYDCMRFGQIAALPIKQIAKPKALRSPTTVNGGVPPVIGSIVPVNG